MENLLSIENIGAGKSHTRHFALKMADAKSAKGGGV
jgi:hypothetical protein